MICVYELIIAKKKLSILKFYIETLNLIQLQPQVFKAVGAVHNMKWGSILQL